MNATTALIEPSATIEPTVGTGVLAGRFFVGPQSYALIVAPKNGGEHEETKWSKTLKTIAGATSYCDGLANTEAMLAAGSPLAKWARDLRIDGHDDWYLPSRLESLIAFGELKGTPAFDFELDWYWTSTQHASDPDYAWCQVFGNGFQINADEAYRCRARAVRRAPIS